MLAEFKNSLTKEEINDCPLYKYEGEIVLVRREEDKAAALERLRGEKVLGFDTETRPSFSKGKTYAPALLQLAASDVVFLFQLRHAPFDAELAALLSEPAIVKTGVAIRDDMRFLADLHSFEPAGLADLSEMARKNGLLVYGLRSLAARLLGVRISKGVRCTNWNNRSLSARQIAYAATDAWISREIYLRMIQEGIKA